MLGLHDACTGTTHQPICLLGAQHMRSFTTTSAAGFGYTAVPHCCTCVCSRLYQPMQIEVWKHEPLYLQLSSGQIMGLATGLRLIYEALDALLQLLDLLPEHCAIRAALAACSAQVLVIPVLYLTCYMTGGVSTLALEFVNIAPEPCGIL